MTDTDIWQSILTLLLELGKNLAIIVGVAVIGTAIFAGILAWIGHLIDKWSDKDDGNKSGQ